MYSKNWEKLIYSTWEERGYFEPEIFELLHKKDSSLKKETFCIMMPPPNVTGVLHIGHALTFTLQDIITRYKRMMGAKTLWQPGLDHAGIATQNVVEKQLLAKGITKEKLGRDEFIKKIWEWKELSGGKILEQLRILGFSPAFKRTRFTMDEGLVNAVKETFVDWYNKGLIYRGERMINWCTHDGALSDIEVNFTENDSKLYHIRYFLKYPKKNLKYLIVSTTRPETFFGDTALMINPADSRYSHLEKQKVILPLINREIEIILDSYVDLNFGSGVVKVTPAHDQNDYEIAKKHNLDSIVVFDKDGILNSNCGEFNGIERLKARELIVEKLNSLGFIEGIEDYKNRIGKCYRCGNVIEPYISNQWFIKKEIAFGAINRIANKETKFFPPSWINNYNAWMRELRDWCISRQLWWGHRIPVFYCECGHEFVSAKDEINCPKCGSDNITQDPDVLDTWFSSALFSHSTLGFRNGDFGKGTLWQEDDLESFTPNSLLITGFDILFFWVARMMFATDINLDKTAFKDIYLHALVRDEFGEKMSKSRGNVIDPLELCNNYSPDIIRFSLAFLAVQGRDIRLSNKQLDITRNFTNKLYNATSFLNMYAKKRGIVFEIKSSICEFSSNLGIYFKSRLNFLTKTIHDDLALYRFDSYASNMYKFLWNEFCDYGIEFSKGNKDIEENQDCYEIGCVFLESLKLLHPLMPFITEYLFQTLRNKDIDNGLIDSNGAFDSIMIEPFPRDVKQNLEIESCFEIIIDCITTLRRIRANFELGFGTIERVYIILNKTVDKSIFETYFKKLAKVSNIEFTQSKPDKSIGDIGNFSKIYLFLEKTSMDKILNRIQNQIVKIKKEIEKLNKMLENQKFISNAPKEVVLESKNNLMLLKDKLEKLENERDEIAK